MISQIGIINFISNFLFIKLYTWNFKNTFTSYNIGPYVSYLIKSEENLGTKIKFLLSKVEDN